MFYNLPIYMFLWLAICSTHLPIKTKLPRSRKWLISKGFLWNIYWHTCTFWYMTKDDEVHVFLFCSQIQNFCAPTNIRTIAPQKKFSCEKDVSLFQPTWKKNFQRRSWPTRSRQTAKLLRWNSRLFDIEVDLWLEMAE